MPLLLPGRNEFAIGRWPVWRPGQSDQPRRNVFLGGPNFDAFKFPNQRIGLGLQLFGFLLNGRLELLKPALQGLDRFGGAFYVLRLFERPADAARRSGRPPQVGGA